MHAVSYKGEGLQRTLKQTCIFLFITIADTKIEGSASLLLKWAKTFNIPKGGLEMGSVNSLHELIYVREYLASILKSPNLPAHRGLEFICNL